MPICITCNTPVKNLYTTYSKADDRSLGKGVRLTQCPKCKRFADKYVEHDYVVLFIDLVLIKPQVYRHLLFNRLGRTDDKLDPSILRLGILLVLFDVYITWARIERSNDSTSAPSEFSNAPIVTQYLFFLTLNIIATLAQHITIRVLVRWLTKRFPQAHHIHGRYGHQRFGAGASSSSSNNLTLTHSRDGSANQSSSQRNSPMKSHVAAISGQSPNNVQHDENINSPSRMSTSNFPSVDHGSATTGAITPSATYTVGPGHASPSAISTALLVSSCTKLFPILLVIWPTSSTSDDEPLSPDAQSASTTSSSFAHRASNYIGWIVLLNNIEALHILLDCGYLIAGAVAVVGVVSRWLAEGWLLSLVGLMRDGGGYGDGPVSDVLRSWAWICGKM